MDVWDGQVNFQLHGLRFRLDGLREKRTDSLKSCVPEKASEQAWQVVGTEEEPPPHPELEGNPVREVIRNIHAIRKIFSEKWLCDGNFLTYELKKNLNDGSRRWHEEASMTWIDLVVLLRRDFSLR